MSEVAGYPAFAPVSERAQRPLMPLAVRDLRLSFGQATVLDGVSLDLGATGCTMILGPNGAGKSQLLRLLQRLLQLAMLFGANDLGSLMIEENVVAEAGTVHYLTLDQIRAAIEELMRK